MPRLDRLPQINRNSLLTFPAQVNDTTPFVVPGKPLAAYRVATIIASRLSSQQCALIFQNEYRTSLNNVTPLVVNTPSDKTFFKRLQHWKISGS